LTYSPKFREPRNDEEIIRENMRIIIEEDVPYAMSHSESKIEELRFLLQETKKVLMLVRDIIGDDLVIDYGCRLEKAEKQVNEREQSDDSTSNG